MTPNKRYQNSWFAKFFGCFTLLVFLSPMALSAVPVILDFDYDDCSYANSCAQDLLFEVNITDDISPATLIIDFHLDENNDGVFDLLGSNITPYPYPNPDNLPVLIIDYADPNNDGIWTASAILPDIQLEIENNIVWRVSDGSNVVQENEVFKILDCNPPTVELAGQLIDGLNTCEFQLPATFFDNGSFDNCGIKQFFIVSPSFGANQTSPPLNATATFTFDYWDIGFNSIDIWIEDNNGNFSFNTTFLILQNNVSSVDCGFPSPITGQISTEDGRNVEDVLVTMESDFGFSYTDSNHLGNYSFSASNGQNYSITPEKLDDLRGGISTLDLILISRHIIGLQSLDSPFKQIAADVNNDQSIDAFDLLDLQKVILFVDNQFANNNSFRFIDSDYYFFNSPFDESFPEQIILGSTSPYSVDFVAVKIGDVNNSAQLNSSDFGTNRSINDELVFQVADQKLKAGKAYKIDFTAQDFNNIFGYQFTLDFDPKMISFGSANSVETATLFGTSLADEGVLTCSFASPNLVSLDNGTLVFSLNITANKDGKLSDILKINNDRYTKPEAYNSNLDQLGIGLQFTDSQVITTKTDEYKLYQNSPNPFSNYTEIEFELPEALKATITFYDTAGRIIYQIDKEYAKGKHKEFIEKSAFKSNLSGVFYYQLATENFRDIKKMVAFP